MPVESPNQYDKEFPERRAAEEAAAKESATPKVDKVTEGEETTLRTSMPLEKQFETSKTLIEAYAKARGAAESALSAALIAGENTADLEATLKKADAEWQIENKIYTDLENKLFPERKLAEQISPQEAQSKETPKERTVVSPEIIENFSPIKDYPERRDEIKENIAKGGGWNQMLVDYWAKRAIEDKKPAEEKADVKSRGWGERLIDFWAKRETPNETGSKKQGNKKESVAYRLGRKTREVWDSTKEWIAKPSWLKERLKGVLTFGFWEIHQAEKFRSGKKKT